MDGVIDGSIVVMGGIASDRRSASSSKDAHPIVLIQLNHSRGRVKLITILVLGMSTTLVLIQSNHSRGRAHLY